MTRIGGAAAWATCLALACVLAPASSALGQTTETTEATEAAEPAGEAGEAAESTATGGDQVQVSQAAIEREERRLKLLEDRRDAVARREALAEAVRQLTLEAGEIDKLEEPEYPYQSRRPHPSLSGFDPDMALVTLERMVRPFTGNNVRDTYIRWHLMWVVKRGSDEDKELMGRRLVTLVNGMPGPLQVPLKPEHRYEPPEVYAEYQRLLHSANGGLYVTEGYPPFVRRLGPPASFAKMPESRRQQAEINWKRAQELRTQFEVIRFPGAREFNNRVRHVNYLIRQYQGELIYTIVETGDPAMLRRVMREIERRARARELLAFDLLSYFYLAAFDGKLNKYDADVLRELSSNLERVARAQQDWRQYGNQSRNFGDYAFHMIYMLRDQDSFIAPEEASQGPVRRGRFQ